MKFISEPVLKWFGYSRRERRSAFILLIIILIILILRYFVPARNIEIEYLSSGSSGPENRSKNVNNNEPAERELFKFDPNKASFETIVKLGFTSRQANNLIRYRESGGRFKKPSDIKEVYGIDEKQAERIVPFIDIKPDSSVKIKSGSYQKKIPLLDLNSCDSVSLDKLPGIGPVLSKRIIKYRQLLGGFSSVDQLKEVYGLPPETYDLIKARVFADTSVLIKTKINNADFKALMRLPYIERFEATSILKYRELNGRIESVNNLIENKLIPPDKAKKIRPYLNFE
jgi:competence protein ComEA